MMLDFDVLHDIFETVTGSSIDKKKLVQMISNEIGGRVGQRDVRKILDAYIDITARTLSSGGKVHLSGLGALEHKPQAPRHYPHPHQGSKLVKGRSTVRFKLSSGLKDRMNKGR